MVDYRTSNGRFIVKKTDDGSVFFKDLDKEMGWILVNEDISQDAIFVSFLISLLETVDHLELRLSNEVKLRYLATDEALMNGVDQ